MPSSTTAGGAPPPAALVAAADHLVDACSASFADDAVFVVHEHLSPHPLAGVA